MFVIKKYFGIFLNEIFDINEDSKVLVFKIRERLLLFVFNYYVSFLMNMVYLLVVRSSGFMFYGV